MVYLIWLLGVASLHMVNSIPCYTEIKSSKAMYRRHGPFLVEYQYKCALACNCASGVNHGYDDCTVFNPPLPNVDCQAYSYDFDTRQCALLGGERTNTCALPATIYDMGMCSTTNPKCGPTTLGDKVFCDSEGYTCPSGFLPYSFLNGSLISRGASRVYFDGTNWLDNSSAGIVNLHRFVQNITCLPAPSHSHPACDGPSPLLITALKVNNTFECFPGFKFTGSQYRPTTRSIFFNTIPVCTANGWAEKEGGPLIVGNLTSVQCADKV